LIGLICLKVYIFFKYN